MQTLPHRVVLFDIDGTLIRSQGAGKKALAKALREDFSVEEPDVEVSFAGRTDLSLVKELFERNSLTLSHDDTRKFFASYVNHLPTALEESQGEVIAGVVPLLEHLLKDDEIILGLLTGNIRAGALAKLEHFKLAHYFKFGGFGDNQEDRAEIAREGVRALETALDMRVNPKKVLVIGDTPFDVHCAHAIGARSLAVCSGYSTREEIEAAKPMYVMEDLRQITLVLAILDAMDL